MPLPKVLGRTFPNPIESLEENIPLLGSILMGFEGLLFVTVATSGESEARANFEPLLGLFSNSNLTLNRRGFVLSVAGTSFALFYVSLLLMVYSRMSRFRHLMSPDDIKKEIDGDQTNGGELARDIENEIRRLDQRRFRFSVFSMLAFNTAVILTGINGLIFAPTLLFSVGTEVLLIYWIANFRLLYVTWKSPPPPYTLDPDNPTF